MRSPIALADTLEAEDGGDAARLFEGVVFHGVRGDPALFYDAEDEVDNPDRPLPIVDSTDPSSRTRSTRCAAACRCAPCWPSAGGCR